MINSIPDFQQQIQSKHQLRERELDQVRLSSESSFFLQLYVLYQSLLVTQLEQQFREQIVQHMKAPLQILELSCYVLHHLKYQVVVLSPKLE